MQILTGDARRGRHAVLIFGLGMIGRTIRDALLRSQFALARNLPFDWQDPHKRRQACARAEEALSGLAVGPGGVSIVWSAGSTNFFSTEDETARENEVFEDVLGLATSLRKVAQQHTVAFHFLSSAGGLFEGQKFVGDHSQPSPQRPYGAMKLRQERRVAQTFAPGTFALYRPSSAYGPMRRPRRHGLINKLIADAAGRQVTVLDANVMALRDYVYAEDIGGYIARQVRQGIGNEGPAHFLVSARCASIFEVVTRIERTMRQRVRFRYDEFFGNSASITFADSVLPPGWRPSTLEVGIRRFILKDMPQTRPIATPFLRPAPGA